MNHENRGNLPVASSFLQHFSKKHKAPPCHLFAHEPGVDGGPDVVGVHGPRRPVHADHVAVLHQKETQPSNRKNIYNSILLFT